MPGSTSRPTSVVSSDDTLFRLAILPEKDRIRIINRLNRMVAVSERTVIAREARGDRLSRRAI